MINRMARLSAALLGASMLVSAGSASAALISLKLDPTASNGVANVAPTGSGGSAFSTDGGTGWFFGGVTLSGSTGTETTGTANYSLWSAIDIIHFDNVSPAVATGVGNDGSPNNHWSFFATVHVTGTGTWTNGFYTANTSTTTLNLWASQGNADTIGFGGANVTQGASSLSDFGNLGFSNSGPSCYTSGGNVGGGGAPTCLLLAQTTSELSPGSSLTIDDHAQESADNIKFSIGTQLTPESYAIGPSGAFFVSPPDPSQFGLVVISGCAAVTPQQVSIGEANGPNSDPNFFGTASQQNGNAPCNPSATGVANNHDPVGWDFVGNDVPEPSGLALVGSGLVVLGLWRRRSTRKA